MVSFYGGVAVGEPGLMADPTHPISAPPDREPSSEEAILWARLQESPDASTRKQLIQMHAGLAKQSAVSLLSRFPGLGLDVRDFTQTAITGLIEAVDRFDPTAGIRFASFARKRIRGALLNELPKETELTSQLSFRRRILRERTADLSKQGNDIFLEMVDIAVGLAVGFMLEDSAMYASTDSHAKSSGAPGGKVQEIGALSEQLRGLLKNLSDKQQRVLEGHYLKGKPFKNIADEMGISAARVSQLHRSGLNELRRLLQKRGDIDVVV